ncbi:protein snail homolog Sna-like [Mytilus californianus]|uniref:protein snail homolog Sna-like n=1 Tax=Mytilus californianus TaxID=6549 RepID=UPI002246F17F|nr:protein snail homolog Sna-like [Mytilus californianus]
MPKCYLNGIRGYRTGKYKSNTEHDPYVMTTRSGLSIKKIPGPRGLGVATKQQTQLPRQSKESVVTKKYPVIKYKSLSYLSFVTRFALALRVPELELAGVNPKETLEYLGDDGYFYRSNSDSTSSGGDSNDEDYESESGDEVFEGVDDNVFYGSEDDDNKNSQGENDSLCDSVSDIRLTDENQNFSDNSADLIVDSSQNLESKFLGVSLSTISGPDINRLNETDKPFALQLKTETQISFKCEDCERSFTIYSAYQAHVRSHSKQRNRCGVCGKIFTRSWLLKGHMRTHTGERPFPCPAEGCDKAFADKSNLRSHMLIHSVTTKNFTCQKCGRAFAQKRYLHKHMLEVCRLI